MRQVGLFVLVLMCAAEPAAGAPEDAIVGIYATLGASRSELGTGFFTSRNGTIVTAYHVVRAATKIRVVTAQGTVHEDIRIVSLAADRDLAVLEIISRPETRTFLTVVERVPQPTEALQVIGYPRGLPRQVISARSTSGALVSSLALRDNRGRRIFASDIPLVPLDATIYSGMSGAPIIGGDGVMGVLSGSFDEGGTIAWMIPALHFKNLVTLNKAPSEVVAWPPFELMGSTFRSLSRRFVIDQRAEKMLEDFLVAIDRCSDAGQRIGESALKLDAQMALVQPLLRLMLTDPAVSQNPDTAREILDTPIQTFFALMETYGKAHTEFGEASVELTNRGTELQQWAKHLAASDQDVAKIAQSMDARFRDIDTRGYYERVGSNPEEFVKGVTQLAAAFAKISGPSPENIREFARVMLSVFQSWQPEIRRHASQQGIFVMRDHIGNFRNLLAGFESLVYRP